MAKLTRDSFIESLKEMTILEIKDLVDAMKDEFGIDPMAVAVAAPAAGGEEAAADSGLKTVVLAAIGDSRPKVIKAVKDMLGLSLGEAKDLVDALGTIKENVKADEANEMKEALEAVGATIELK